MVKTKRTATSPLEDTPKKHAKVDNFEEDESLSEHSDEEAHLEKNNEKRGRGRPKNTILKTPKVWSLDNELKLLSLLETNDNYDKWTNAKRDGIKLLKHSKIVSTEFAEILNLPNITGEDVMKQIAEFERSQKKAITLLLNVGKASLSIEEKLNIDKIKEKVLSKCRHFDRLKPLIKAEIEIWNTSPSPSANSKQNVTPYTGTRESRSRHQQPSTSPIAFKSGVSNNNAPLKKSSSLIHSFKQIIPSLDSNKQKGQAGRICIVGGSEQYSGAPYFAGIAALRAGADLCHVLCIPDASNSIKSYSPDLIVHPYLTSTSTPLPENTLETKITPLLNRIDVVVVGPGLGRDVESQKIAVEIVKIAKTLQIPIIFDGDGINIVENDVELVKGYGLALVTPNFYEFRRLCTALGVDEADSDAAGLCSEKMGHVVVLKKGEKDLISDGSGNGDVLSVSGGVSRRCGGMGDILSGVLGTFLFWAKEFESGQEDNDEDEDPFLVCVYAACLLVKSCALRASKEAKGRSLLASDLIGCIGPEFENLFG